MTETTLYLISNISAMAVSHLLSYNMSHFHKAKPSEPPKRYVEATSLHSYAHFCALGV